MIEFNTLLEWATSTEVNLHDFLQYCKEKYGKSSSDEITELTFNTLMENFEESRNH